MSDPQASLLARLLPNNVGISRVQLALNIFFAVLVEFGAAMGLYMATRHGAVTVRAPAPRRRSGSDREACALAVEAADALDKSKFPIDRRLMLSTWEFEQLHALIRKFGRDVVVRGLNRAMRGTRRPEEGYRACCWAWFDIEIVEETRGTGSGTMQPRGAAKSRSSRRGRASQAAY